jgi:hypothetical protein
VHAHPFEARGEGLIVSRSVDDPGGVLATAYYGPTVLLCDGSTSAPLEHEEREEKEGELHTLDRAADDD